MCVLFLFPSPRKYVVGTPPRCRPREKTEAMSDLVCFGAKVLSFRACGQVARVPTSTEAPCYLFACQSLPRPLRFSE